MNYAKFYKKIRQTFINVEKLFIGVRDSKFKAFNI